MLLTEMDTVFTISRSAKSNLLETGKVHFHFLMVGTIYIIN